VILKKKRYMPKLPTIRPKQLVQVLRRLGFVQHRQHGTSHLIMKHSDGRRTVVPIHSKDIPKGTLMGILKDIEVSKSELITHL